MCPFNVWTDFFFSIPVIGCTGLTILLLLWAYKWQQAGTKLDSTQQLIMIWHLTNGTWWSLGCDVMSGLFAVMPLLNNTYLIIDSKHKLGPPFSDPRINLDVVYLTELTVHVPLSIIVFFCYASRSRARYLLEPLLGGSACLAHCNMPYIYFLHSFFLVIFYNCC